MDILRSTTPTQSSVTTVIARKSSAAKRSARTTHAATTTPRFFGADTIRCDGSGCTADQCCDKGKLQSKMCFFHLFIMTVYRQHLPEHEQNLSTNLNEPDTDAMIHLLFPSGVKPIPSYIEKRLVHVSLTVCRYPSGSESPHQRQRKHAVLQLHQLTQRLHSDQERPRREVRWR